MRKRSTYRPREKLQDTMAWVMSGFKPITVAHDVIQKVRIMNHGAIEAVRKGEATWEDVSALVVAFKIAQALAAQGKGSDWLPEISAALAVARDLENRDKWLLRGGELATITLAMDVHDVQLDSCTVDDMAQATRDVKQFLAVRRSEAARA